jgi:CDGSH-type Zn-finger protein
MDKAVVAQRAPYQVDVEAGKAYFWCACGRSLKQPFCDGSHKGTSFSPVQFKPEESKTVWLCGCKHTKSSPMCDGTHKSL